EADGRFKSRDTIQSTFRKLNPDQKPMTFSCGSGLTACILLIGAELAGSSQNAIYDGSWTEWGSRTDLPLER
ncbi:MAG: sulfurtransferase, partial [Bacteroidota bacterium]